MKRMKFYLLVFVLSCLAVRGWANGGEACRVMRGLVSRIAPAHADRFRFELTADTVERFTVRSEGRRIVITGRSAIAMAVGLNHYLRRYCLTEVSWRRINPIVLPRELPRVSRTMTGRARVAERFFLNYCTFGYTMPWWRWADWERLIDWMALNGVTMPLAITGTEAVWQRVWRREGLTDRHLARFFTGPAHLPWHRMLNINGWQGPLPQSWIDGQADLQRRILQREREFGMRPVLPAFNGSVPLDYKRLHPEARITEVGQWGGFGQAYRTYFLSPTDPRFDKLQKSFLDEQRRMFGTDHLYCLDSFNEVQPPSWSPDTLCMLARHIHVSLDKADPQSVWVQMGWLFYNDRKHWTPNAIRAYLSGIPRDRALLLDYYIDHTELWRLTESFYGRPYIACVLGNFGGNTMLQGDVGKVSSRLDAAIAQGGNMAGVGATMEGFGVNPDFYAFVFDKAWDCGTTDRDWLCHMADRRVGFASAAGRTAWQVLFDRIMPSYVNESGTVVCARPSFEARYLNTTYPAELLGVWKTLLDIDSDKREHLYDIVNVGRQVLGDFFAFERDGLHRAYLSQRSDSVDYYACRMDKMLDDLDRLLACNEEFSLRKWIEDARGFGATAAEKDYYERNARTLITVWGDSRQLTDYANRTWAGLVSSYYKQRWHIFTAHVRRAVRLKQPLDAKACDKEIEAFERRWIEPEITKIAFPKACKAVRQTAREIYDSWFGAARQAPLPHMSPPLE